MPPTRSARLSVIGASLSCWLISMALPAMQFHENPGLPSAQTISHSGFEMAFASIFGLLYFNFVLFANPLLLFGWIFLAQQRYRRAAFWLVPAALLALETFQLRGQKFYEDEGGSNISYMTHPQIGWYLWIASIVLPMAAALRWRRFQQSPPTLKEPTQ
jgi:hypothetical protein